MNISASTEKMGDALVSSLFEDFFLAANDFSLMQQDHRAALLAGNGKDLFFWRQSRERAFRSLTRNLDKVVACGQDNAEGVVRVREVMGKLLAEEDVLQELILAQRLKMQEQLLAMRRGKEVLQGYSMNKGQVPRPRYLSSRM